MKKDKELIKKILVISFIALTVFSLVNLYYVQQRPTFERRTVTLASYMHKAFYDCVAELKPNVIYNKTVLRPDEGILYTSLTNRINVTFTYVFASNPSPEKLNVTMESVAAKIESPGRWVKYLQETELVELLNFRGSLNFTLEINCPAIRNIAHAIDKELGMYSSSYSIYVMPNINIEAVLAGREVGEKFTPQLTVVFKSTTDKGSYISLEGLNQTENKEIRETIEVGYPDVELQKDASYAVTAVMISGLVVSTALYFKGSRKAKKESSEIAKTEKVAEEYKDLIIEATRLPPETWTTIDVKSLGDLVKIAEVLTKPILKAEDGECLVYYIMDGEVKYQYMIQRKSKDIN
ncbi:MAG: DUF5305 family protein [Candidatus Nezhaarchaeales archaeon]